MATRTPRPSRRQDRRRARRTERPQARRPQGAGLRDAGRRGAAATLPRLRIGFLLVAMIVSVFAVRLFQLQGLDARTYAERARAVGAVQEILPATRGSIVDRAGVPFAESLDGSMIVADPTKTGDDAAAIAGYLVEELGVEYAATVTNLTWPDTRFRYIARRVPTTRATAVVAELTARGYRGLDIRRDPVRSYPAGDVGANVVGYVNDEGLPAGGMEEMFEGLLNGTDGSATYDVGGGNRIPLGDNSTTEPIDGKDLTLTLDRDLQWYTQRVLRQTVEDTGATRGMAVVMDARTGEILALADDPTFDPNETYQEDLERLGAPSARLYYEPGSVQKVLTAAALVDAGVVTPQTPLLVPPTLESSGKTINDHYDHGTVRLTMAGVIAKSSNIGTSMAAREMAPTTLARYLRGFGLGSRPGIPGIGEVAGSLRPANRWIQIEQDNIAFGQGIGVTAVQMAAALNTLANDGEYVQPSLVKGRATTVHGEETGSEVAVRRQVVSPEAADAVAQMMEMVVTEGAGTAPNAGIAGYRVAGKTGTAQKINPDTGSYDASKYVLSFGGFAPADDPRFTVYVAIDEPKGGSGGGVAGPVFRRILAYALQHYAVPPTGTAPADLPVTWRKARQAADRPR